MLELRGKRVLVVGMGKSGHAAVDLLLEKGAAPVATDTRPAAELGDLRVPFVEQGEAALDGMDLVVLSPGVAVDAPLVEEARRRGIGITGEVELAGHFLEGPVIGITGSNGKTTTTAMIGHILRENQIPCQVGGNIGTAPAAMIHSSRAEQWNVLELSSFQLETVEEFRAKIGVILNITPDHLDRHHTFEAYTAAKRRLFETQDEDGFAVLNYDDPVTRDFAAHTKAQVVWFRFSRLERGMWLEGDEIVWDGAPVMKAAEIPLPGRHNVENVLAASAAARLAGASLPGIRRAVMSFAGVEHRLEFVRELRGVRYYNDSKATNVDATQKAIDAFPGGLWIILGGKDKGSDYRVLAEGLRAKAKAVLLIGAAAAKIAGQLEGVVPLERCGTLEVAVKRGFEQAREGEIVLLAPACASFDQFQSYEHRGRMFKTFVNALV